MKEIKLTQGKVALVDDDDYENLNQFKWYAHVTKDGIYARSNIKIDGKSKTILMHRFILKLTESVPLIDHMDTNGLNNQKWNLRECDKIQNGRNSRKKKMGSSKYKGVCWNKKNNNWTAYISIRGTRRHLGSFKNEQEAALAYDKAAKKHYKEFARVNL